jgi:hypothetical protein
MYELPLLSAKVRCVAPESSALEIDFLTAAAASFVSKLSSRPVFAMPMRIST